MFTAMAVIGLTTLTLLLTNPSLLNTMSSSSSSSSSSSQMSSTPHTCTDSDKSLIFSQLPACNPRNITIKIPIPSDPHLNIINVVPREIEVPRCVGTCYNQDGNYKRCISTARVNTSIPVMYEVTVQGKASLQEMCASQEIEVHTACSCGCESRQCSSLQLFDERICDCRCADQGARGQCLVQYNKVWDPDLCSCKCRPEEHKECSTGYNYDGVYSCQCLPASLSAATSIMVITGAMAVVFFSLSIFFYVKLKKARKEVNELKISNEGERLFPQSYQ